MRVEPKHNGSTNGLESRKCVNRPIECKSISKEPKTNPQKNVYRIFGVDRVFIGIRYGFHGAPVSRTQPKSIKNRKKLYCLIVCTWIMVFEHNTHIPDPILHGNIIANYFICESEPLQAVMSRAINLNSISLLQRTKGQSGISTVWINVCVCFCFENSEEIRNHFEELLQSMWNDLRETCGSAASNQLLFRFMSFQVD